MLPDSDFTVSLASDGREMLELAAGDAPDLVIMDLQMRNSGGIAGCLDLRLEASAGRLPLIPVLLLLDRRADVFMARRAGAQGWVIKPLDPIRLRKAVRSLLDGGSYTDDSFKPRPSLVSE